MTTDLESPWFPLFEFEDWRYRSYLVLPTPEDEHAKPGSPAQARKWAQGAFACGQAMRDVPGYALDGVLTLAPGVTLAVKASGTLGRGQAPATFEATGTGVNGPLKGALYDLTGWVFPVATVANGAARVQRVCGAIRAVRGPDPRPDADPGGAALGTVGTFLIVRGGA
jgi:hypothetical protein